MVRGPDQCLLRPSNQGRTTAPTGSPPGMSEAALKRVTIDNCPTADELEKVYYYYYILQSVCITHLSSIL